MLTRKTSRPRSSDFYDAEDQAPRDFDPEDTRPEFSDSDASGSESEDNTADQSRKHYAPVEKSKLRVKEAPALGPQYKGSKTSRNALTLENDHDPFVEYGEEEGSDVEEAGLSDRFFNKTNGASGSEQSDEENVEGSNREMEDGMMTSETSLSDDEGEDDDDDEDKEEEGAYDGRNPSEDRAQLRKIMNEEPKNVAATIAEANRADAEKGLAVKQQRKTFDSILNGRIRLQQGLVALNSLQKSSGSENAIAGRDAVRDAEKAAVNLWNTLELLRQTMHETRTGTKRKHLEANADMSSAQVWSHMKELERDCKSHRRNVLEKWSAKTQGATTQSTSRRLINTARQTTIVDVLDEQLSNKDRLIKRTRTPRSCAPIQANAGISEAADIYDDADFYGIMLKELLEQRSIESASNVQVDTAMNQWQAVREAKTKKNVDTKASKGRKLRYTVHEKLQNFMAPENRGTWTERQIDELFGSLLGKRLLLGEAEMDNTEEAEENAEENALMLFRN